MNPTDLFTLKHLRLEGLSGLLLYVAFASFSIASFGGVAGVPWIYTTATAAVAALIIVGWWLGLRRLPHFGRHEIGIAVAVAITGKQRAPKEVDDTLDALVASLRSEAVRAVPTAASGIRFRVERLPSHVVVRDHDHANELVEEMNASYLLWGATARLGKTRARGGLALDLGTLHFCVRHGAVRPDRHPLFLRTLEQVQELPQPYRVHLDNDVEDIRLVGEKIGLATKYHLGMAAATKGLREVGIPLLTSCLGDERFRFQRSARRTIAELWTAGWGGNSWPTPRTDVVTAERAKQDGLAALEVLPRSEHGLVLLVNACFVLGEIADSVRWNEQLRTINEPVFRTNRAVFAIAQQKYDDALTQYRRLKKLKFGDAKGASSESIRVSASAWLSEAQEVLGPGYGFGLAFINDELGDPVLALIEYEKVLPELEASPAARRYAEERIAALRSELQSQPALSPTPPYTAPR